MEEKDEKYIKNALLEAKRNGYWEPVINHEDNTIVYTLKLHTQNHKTIPVIQFTIGRDDKVYRFDENSKPIKVYIDSTIPIIENIRFDKENDEVVESKDMMVFRVLLTLYISEKLNI